MLAAASTLERAGARLIDMVVPSAEQAQTNIHICMARADMADIHRDEMERRPTRSVPRCCAGCAWARHKRARLRGGPQMARAVAARLARDVQGRGPAFDTDHPIVAPLRKASADMVETTQALARFTVGIGCAGLPALTLPCGFGEAGMPIGAQLVAKWLDEALLFRAGCAFQKGTEFHLARPPLVTHG